MPDASIQACIARAFSDVSKQKTRQYSSSPRVPAYVRYSPPAEILSITAATSSSSQRRRGSSRLSSALCGSRFNALANGFPLRRTMAQRFLMKASAAERVVKCVTVKRREPQTLHRTPASSSVRPSPRCAPSTSTVRTPRRMQCWHSTPINRAPSPLATSCKVNEDKPMRRPSSAQPAGRPRRSRSSRSLAVSSAGRGTPPTKPHGRGETH